MQRDFFFSKYLKLFVTFATVYFSILLLLASCSTSKNLIDTFENRTSEKESLVIEIADISLLQLDDLEYQLSEDTCIEGLREFPDNKKLLGLLGVSFFKQEKFELCNKVLNRFFYLNEDVYDSLSTFNDNSNLYFDLFYYHIFSLVELEKVENAQKLIANRLDKITRNNLKIDNRVKLEILEIKISYILEKYQLVVAKINKLLNRFTISSEELKLNLYYLEAISYYKLLDYPTSIDVINKIIEIDEGNLYSLKLFKSLEEIVYLADSEFLETYGDNIVNCYEQILDKSVNKSVRNKILRNIYDLRNSSISVNLNLKEENSTGEKNGTSVLSRISITTDKSNTKVQFSSNDSLRYEYMYDGKSLEISLDRITIKSENNSITPKEGSGIKSLKWELDKKSNRLLFKLTFNDDYDMNFEELFDNFEKSEGYSKKYHLILNISLPEDDFYSTEGFNVSERLNEKGKRKKYTIIIDPGHGGDDPGAIGVKRKKDGKTRYTEKEVALTLSKELKKYLEKEGYRVFLTRTKDTYPTLPERNRIAESRNADMFLSIHLNSAHKKNRKYWQTDRYYGSEMIVRKTLGSQPKIINSVTGNRKDSKKRWLNKRRKALKNHIKLSNIFSRTIPSSLHKPFNKKRRIKYKNLAIFSGLTIPHALIETGFIINNRSLEYLLSKRGQNALFKGIANGIKEYRGK